MPTNRPEFSETLEHIVGIALRRRWWFLTTFSVVAIGAMGVYFMLPKHYKSEATILVQRQQIPERYVVPNTTTNLDQALQAMTQDILSRPRLLEIVDQYNLYPQKRKKIGPEQLTKLMRKDIEITSIENPDEQSKGVNAFTISYSAENPEAAEVVTNRLTSLFITEDLRTQQQRDIGTTTFLANQLKAAQADLESKEQRLKDFKMQALGELPEQQQGNLEILGTLQMQLQNTSAAIGRANEQRVYLESLLTQYENMPPGATASGAALNPLDSARVHLAQLENKKAELLSRFSPEYPDVRQVTRQIGQTRALLAQLEKSKKPETTTSSTAPSGGSGGPALVPEDTTIAQLKSQLKENQLEIANQTARQEQLDQQIAEYQRRLNLTPVREQQLSDLLRDYDLAKKNYDDLYAKKTESALATDLAANQQGERFRLIDPPTRPTRPFRPDPLRFTFGGFVGGILLGAAVAFFIETKDKSYYSEKALRARFDLPLMMGLPLLRTKREERRRSARMAMEWLSGTIMVLAVLAAEFYFFRRG
ncbi:MAG TPA: Wzz/FepE/Etk N-terminal domain-containing protein [Terriglobales bacterium]|nr:Wzz/FepE/Etk N-terminal domain-containing protein [Terriglobales bacterium]